MSRIELLYLLPYMPALILLAGIFVFTRRNRYVRGAGSFGWIVGGQILTSVGFLLELVSPSLESKVFWATFQWLATAFLVILPFLVFSVELSNYRPGSFVSGILLTFLGGFATVLLTDHIHHLFYQNLRLTDAGPFLRLTYDFTYVIFVYLLLYFYGVQSYGIILLVRRALQPDTVFRLQYLIVAAGFLIPLVVSFVPLVGLQIRSGYEITPFAYATGSLVAAWGLFRYGLFDLTSIARAQIMENLPDPMILVDARNRIVDLNRAALAFLGLPRASVIGSVPDAVFDKWKPLIAVINDPFVSRTEIAVPHEPRPLYFDVNISEILGRKRAVIGRMMVLRETTKLKSLEMELRRVSNEKEQQIKERTEALHTIAERYRTIVENHTDFIIRWKPDGTRTFVNKPYCRYWNMTPEQALARNFLFHPAEEDRPAVEKIVVRLNTGRSDVEMEVHLVRKPDGSAAWLEWRDKAIRDEWGNLIEIQSIGRDVVGRGQAEQD